MICGISNFLGLSFCPFSGLLDACILSFFNLLLDNLPLRTFSTGNAFPVGNGLGFYVSFENTIVAEVGMAFQARPLSKLTITYDLHVVVRVHAGFVPGNVM